MKKINLLLSLAFLISVSFQSCSEDDDKPEETETSTTSDALSVSATQRAVVTYVGATWCPPCGAYGDPTKLHMEDAHGENVVILNVQSGDAISSSSAFGPKFGSAFQSFVSSSSIPHAYWSGANFSMIHRGFYTSASSNNGAADADINSITGNSPNVGVAAKASLSNDVVTIETLSKFYNDEGQHYIGVYLLEDGVMALQKISNSPQANTSHENVLRASAISSNTLGVESMGTIFTVDQEVSGTYTINVPSTVVDKTKLQVAVVIWESNAANGISNGILVDVK